MIDTLTLIEERRTFSQARLGELSRRLAQIPELQRLKDFSVYATGSYARNEASPHSDIDLFFVHCGASSSAKVSRLSELRLFAQIIEAGEQQEFPTFSNDGEFLKFLYLDDMLEMLGGREDDAQNFFTARMLLLLESAPLVNTDFYRQMLASIVEAYFRDYPDHAIDFRPVFLINDIIRFWKTLCLNYEHRRNKPDDDLLRKRSQQVKNFKLKFSRLMTCFGTVVAVCAMQSPIEKEDILALTSLSPLERFMRATDGIKQLASLRSEILRDYHWFLESTALTSEQLHAQFDTMKERTELFRRADLFGDRVYDALAYFAKRNGYRRYLVI
jgi:predicted nucleotidyltransferase